MLNEEQEIEPITRLLKSSVFSPYLKHKKLQEMKINNLPSLYQIIIQISYCLKKCYINNQCLLLTSNIFSDKYGNAYMLYDYEQKLMLPEQNRSISKQIHDCLKKGKLKYYIFGFQSFGADLVSIVDLYYQIFFNMFQILQQNNSDLKNWGSYFSQRKRQIQKKEITDEEIWNFLEESKIYHCFGFYVQMKNTLLALSILSNLKSLSDQLITICLQLREDICKQSIEIKQFIQQCFNKLHKQNIIVLQGNTFKSSSQKDKQQRQDQIPFKLIAYHLNVHLFKQNNAQIFSYVKDKFEYAASEQLSFKVIYQTQSFEECSIKIEFKFPFKISQLEYSHLCEVIEKIQYILQLNIFNNLQLRSQDDLFLIERFKIKFSEYREWRLLLFNQIIEQTDKIILYFLALKPILSVFAKNTAWQGPSFSLQISEQQQCLFNQMEYQNVSKKIKTSLDQYNKINLKSTFSKQSLFN